MSKTPYFKRKNILEKHIYHVIMPLKVHKNNISYFKENFNEK